MNSEDINKNIRKLLDIEEIKTLKAKFCYFVDSGNFTDLLKLFSDNAKVDMGAFGIFEGREAYSKFFTKIFPQALSFSLHMLHNPIIEVTGDKAKGKWYFMVPGTDKLKNKAVWVAGFYNDDFVREDGEWKISLFKADFKFYTPFDEGWLKTRF